ncbi:hypothetical protein, partial [Roseovarius dicentrarchi]|uniref:hypothetical protein n=1 Tax=Roseovarius dicentrarchi TaxID=2250573 RepID=UPI001939CE63
QKSHVYHSMRPQLIQAAARLHMGQFSMTISAGAGSVLNDNQQTMTQNATVFMGSENGRALSLLKPVAPMRKSKQ